MLQQVLQGNDYSLFTMIALALFLLAFILLLVITFLRPKHVDEHDARMPLNDDIEFDQDTDTAQSHEAGQGDK